MAKISDKSREARANALADIGAVRKRPTNATNTAEWQTFCMWADNNGVGMHVDDWQVWWDCWHPAFMFGRDVERLSPR